MRATCGRVRLSPATTRSSQRLFLGSRSTHKPLNGTFTALLSLHGAPNISDGRHDFSTSIHVDIGRNRQKPAIARVCGRLLHSGGAVAEGSLGQSTTQQENSVVCNSVTEEADRRILELLRDAQGDEDQVDSRIWERILVSMRHEFQSDGVWAVLLSMRNRGQVACLSEPNAEDLRDEILSVAFAGDDKLAVLVDVAQQLQSETGFQWPELYMRILHHFLDSSRYDQAVRWHLQLTPKLRPEQDVFGALLASFVTDPTPQMQNCLTSLYVFSMKMNLYDFIIPTLFISGQSKLARTWRKKFLLFEDYPASHKSRPFLRFVATYFPEIELTNQELKVAGLERYGSGRLDKPLRDQARQSSRGKYSDSIVARWFASSWTSVEFAINLVYRLGLQTIGPQSLQSLALRETGAKGVTARITQLEKLGVNIADRAYCKILVAFSRNGEDQLLEDFLHCDVHPDEFEDIETRQMLTAASVKDGDWKTERLFQAIEAALETSPAARRLNSLLTAELSKKQLRPARDVLNRMEALKVQLYQPGATMLLDRVFWGLGDHPEKENRDQTKAGKLADKRLNRAIEVVRRVALHDVAIPLHYWKTLLYNLGRLGRIDQLEQLSLEIVQLYTPPYGGLLPVHRKDVPLTENFHHARKDKALPADDAASVDNTEGCLNESEIEAQQYFQNREAQLDSVFKSEEATEGSNTVARATNLDLPPVETKATVQAMEQTADPFDAITQKMTDSRRGSGLDLPTAKPITATETEEALDAITRKMTEFRRGSEFDSPTGKSKKRAKSVALSPPPSPPSSTPSQPLSVAGRGDVRSTNNAQPVKVKEQLNEDPEVFGNVYNAEEKEYIPADLPFSHRQHPVQKIFDTHLQRSIVRWGFGQIGSSVPTAEGITPQSSHFEAASGVRILAQLRDRGVLIDTQIVRTAVISRIAATRLPGRAGSSGRSRGRLSLHNVKRLVDAAWGPHLLPSVADLDREVEKQKPKLFGRYTKVLDKAFDRQRLDSPRP